ncbi:thioredoxin family protein [Maledivibacter halophilus]|uniref:Thioredoxin domain-containing protein n=1 Tax=Maledivibacter halophilus TaxID=36842 RepID=A0A1T5M554_9FIRM|nr:thioredoxin family protein [Maledivibacter halophilus]SKC83340.1 Thioredoxin domain-containing protein [Maledivibacter halophilus]
MAPIVDRVLTELNLDDDFEIIGDIPSIVKAGIMDPPALMINDKIKLVGKVPTFDEVKKAIEEEM